MNPKAKVWIGLVVTFVLIGGGLFASAGTFAYWQAWVFLGVGAVTSIGVTLTITRDPALLESRMRGGPTMEKRPIQRLIVLSAAVSGLAVFVLAGIDHRLRWSHAPFWLCIAGDALIVASMLMVQRVLKVNSFASATVEVTSAQKVISTGPYRIVRHPMYSSAAVYFVGLSLALGSYWALIPSVLTILVFVWRLLDEESFLAKELPGYQEYCARVRWHLIPGVF